MVGNERWLPQVFNAFALAAASYSMLRAGVRWFGLALPGQCVTNTIINFNIFETGDCGPADPNWLLTRVSFATSAHVWTWIMFGAFVLLITLSSRPFNGMRGIMMTGLAISYHETIWFAGYFVAHPLFAISSATTFHGTLLDLIIQIYGSFLVSMFIAIAIFVVSGYHKDLNLKVFAVASIPFILFMVGWVGIGYPLSLDLQTGVGPLFGDLATNFIEFASWLFPFMVVGAAFYAKVRHQ